MSTSISRMVSAAVIAAGMLLSSIIAAGATAGKPLLLGRSNGAGRFATSLTASVNGAVLKVTNTKTSRFAAEGPQDNKTYDAVEGFGGEGGDGVKGHSIKGNGVSGDSSTSNGVKGTSTGGTGVKGSSDNGTGVSGTSTNGTGGNFSGKTGIDVTGNSNFHNDVMIDGDLNFGPNASGVHSNAKCPNSPRGNGPHQGGGCDPGITSDAGCNATMCGPGVDVGAACSGAVCDVGASGTAACDQSCDSAFSGTAMCTTGGNTCAAGLEGLGSGNGPGLLGACAPAANCPSVIDAFGNVFIQGNLTVTGAKQGYVADLAVNGSSTDLHAGDAVSIVGVRPPALGDIPLIVVGPARPGQAVIGVVDRTQIVHRVLIDGTTTRLFTDGPSTVRPGRFLYVVTLGAFAYASVSAAKGPITPGASLGVGSSPGTMVASTMIHVGGASFVAPGTSVGYALGALRDGSGRIAIFVSPH